MTCYKPLSAWKGAEGRVVFNRSLSPSGVHVLIGCGTCLGCRIERSRVWALRCVHESKLYQDNCFVTLTYSDRFVPEGNTLVKRDLQLFMKRLRKKFEPRKIRFYAAGEYGESNDRPHYHACLFNFNFPDRKIWKKSRSGEHLYRSDALEELWTLGHSSVGTLTWKSAAYTARYIMKKLNGDVARDVYGDRIPPFNLMSRRPGIAHDWFEKFQTDAYPSDYLIIDGRRVPVPKYYDRLYEKWHPEDAMLAGLKVMRKWQFTKTAHDRTKARLEVREAVHKASLNRLKREL